MSLNCDIVHTLSAALEEHSGHIFIDEDNDEDPAGDPLDKQKDTEFFKLLAASTLGDICEDATVDELVGGIARMKLSVS